MPIETTLTLYRFDELSDAAKETARQWWRDCRDASDLDSVIDDFENVADALGIDLKRVPVRLMGGDIRSDPDVSWSVGYCQSDFAAFAGRYTFQRGSTAKIKAYAPQDSELHRIAAEISNAQARHGFKLSAVISYSSYWGMQADIEHDSGREVSDAAYSQLSEAFKDLAAWLYSALRREDEWQSADAQVDDAMRANEYTFEHDGKRRD